MNNNKFKHILHLGCTILFVFLIFSCGSKKDRDTIIFNFPAEAPAGINYPDARFAVISDLHLYDHVLGTSGTAFEKALNSDRKLLLEGIELIDYAIEEIIASGVSFVLVSGDLTKDGELANHELAASKLKKLADAGIASYVITGNHDINNPDAVSFYEDSTASVASVTSWDFEGIYGDYGYNNAIFRDDDSLSYIAEPIEGLWLLAIDTCRYREKIPGTHAITSGKISQRTADWIAVMLQTAMDHDKAVMAMMHHGVVEHWTGKKKLHPDYLIEGFEEFGKFLASYNVRLVFTGHYHAQDITLGQFDNKFIYDIATGSLVTAPCPIRYVELNNSYLNVITEKIAGKTRLGPGLAEKGQDVITRIVKSEARRTLKKFKASDKDADYIAEAVGEAFVAHYAGDEDESLRKPIDKSKLGLWGRVIYGQFKYAIDGLWKDLPPEDNNARFWL